MSEIKLLEQIWEISPVVFVLVVFLLIVFILYKAGLISFDSTDTEIIKVEKDLEDLQKALHELEREISYIKGRLDL